MLQFHLPSLKTSLLTIGILMIPLFAYLIWTTTSSPATLSKATDPASEAGKLVREDFQLLPALPFTEEDRTYTVTDTATDGIQITFANTETKPEEKPKLNLSFPKDYAEPIEVKLDEKRTIKITDLSGKNGYTSEPLQTDALPREEQGFFARLFDTETEDAPKQYLRYTSKDDRKSLLYAFQKDQATGEKKLKHWTIYQEGTGLETESYQFENAKVRINEGKAEVFYYGEQDLKNDQAVAEVDTNLLERAQRTLAKEMGEDLLSGTHTPDFTIPEPYYLDREGEKHEAEWKWNEEASTLSVTLTPDQSLYPIALDPTLAFTAPGVSNGGSVITGEAGSSFGYSMVTGDFNADGKTDLAVGAFAEISYTGRVYIFYNDGTYPTSGADVVITGETNTQFGAYIGAGDFNADGRTDLVTGAVPYSSQTGRAYIFYNDGAYPVAAVSADVIIIGEATNNYFGVAFTAGDFNADGRTDLAVASSGYSTNKGRLYIFYNDGSYPATAASADVIITGNASNDYFGTGLSAGDFNADGRTDLVVSSPYYSSSTGRAYIFYGDGSIPTTAATADVIITGNATSDEFGIALTAADLNADGKVDLAIAAPSYSSSTGRAYIFYNDGSIPTTAATADVTITGETTSNQFGYALTSGDFNADGRTDLAVGAYYIGSGTGRAYIFYNDASIPTTAATADVVIIGEAGNYGSYFGHSLVSGDFNADGRIDLVVAADYYNSSAGRVYFFYSQNGQMNTNKSITGETTNNYFGYALVTGDWNADGWTDLAVGAYGYSTSTGRTYVFYGDGQIPNTAGTADVIITGETTNNSFGKFLTSGDLNADGKTDLVISSYAYSSNTGRAYIFYNGSLITENASGADVIITGETTGDFFGNALTASDFNTDGEVDLAVSSYAYSAGDTGRAYLFYGGSIITENASGADVIITGETIGDTFGQALIGGDLNTDGKLDLVIGSSEYPSHTGTGRVYIFYGGSIITENASGADVIIDGQQALNAFSASLAVGDLNADGRMDLIVGNYGYPLFDYVGRVYIFYNDGSFPATAATADVILSGEAINNYFGGSLVAADFNADGKTDLAVGANGNSSGFGRAYIFYNGSLITENASGADVIITGEAASNYFGIFLASGDFNADGRADLIVGAHGNGTNTGKVYFYETRENFAWEIQEQFGNTPRTGINGSGQELQITGEVGSYMGSAMTTGDFNADGRTDLAISASSYSSSTGRVYMFYADGSLPNGANNADVVIVGEVSSAFGNSLASADLNTDGKIDLVVGANSYSSSTGRVYVFYNDGSYPGVATLADVIITGGATDDKFGEVITSGDFNADGLTDLAVGAWQYSFNVGRAYIFYGGSIITEGVGGADVIITGEGGYFSSGALTTGDFNADGRTDLAVGAYFYSSAVGRAYLFYGGSIITENASGADVIINGEAGTGAFGARIISGDLNADGKTDLAVGAWNYSSATGRAYVFHADGTNNFGTATCSGTPAVCSAGNADAIITGETTSNQFGGTGMATGDFNADGKTDLAVGSNTYSSSTGRAYIFYNGSIITESASGADTILTGEATGNYFGQALTSGDLNADGKIDLVVSGYGYQTNRGKVYVYTWNDPVITGETIDTRLGSSLVTGDWNADGRIDLAAGAFGYSSDTGRVYLFYGGSIITENASGADVIITGEAMSNYFSSSLVAGDFNADGRTDLVVGASSYSSGTGRAYLFYGGSIITENASGADVIITGEATSYLGNFLISGDWNADGLTDLASSAYGHSSFTGRVYLFYGGSIITENASGADIIITGEAASNTLGFSLASGDWNADGRTDLAVSASGYSSSTGRVYLFYGGSIITENASGADIIITGEVTGNNLGYSFASGDWNADGRTDLAVGAIMYNPGGAVQTGRAYLFYGGSIVTENASGADVIITGEATGSHFGYFLVPGDWNADGKTDLAVGASGYSTGTGRVYLFSGGSIVTENASGADSMVNGEITSGNFGRFLVTGDFNTDGKVDLAVSAYNYYSSTGRVYFFISEVAKTITPPGTSYLKGTGKLKGTMKWK